MDKLDVVVRFAIKSGHLDAFRHWAEKCQDNVKQHGEGMSKYDWFINGSTCVVLESYDDSAALLKHVSDLGNLLMEGSDHFDSLEGDVYGVPSQEVVDSLANLKVKYYGHL